MWQADFTVVQSANGKVLPPVPVNGVSMAALGAGIIFLWSAVENQHVTTALQDLLIGKQPPAGAGPSSLSDEAGSQGAVNEGTAGPAPGNISGNVALGKTLAAAYGWGSGSEWNSLYALWERESGWSNTEENASSGALGIAQALGHGPTNQYPDAACNAPEYSPSCQINWGLGYIKSTYGDPDAAWAHETSAGWY